MTLDKNKAAYKLKGIGPVYYLNLDGQPDRKEYMEDQFKYWEIENYERISAYDGRDDDLSDIIHGRYPENMSSGEIGCVTSHLKILKHFLENSDSPYCVVMEDDIEDGDDVRYGELTLHAEHGIAVALNLGDLLLGDGYGQELYAHQQRSHAIRQGQDQLYAHSSAKGRLPQLVYIRIAKAYAGARYDDCSLLVANTTQSRA